VCVCVCVCLCLEISVNAFGLFSQFTVPICTGWYVGLLPKPYKKSQPCSVTAEGEKLKEILAMRLFRVHEHLSGPVRQFQAGYYFVSINNHAL